MRAVVQRVLNANVKVDGEITGEIQKGILVFLGVTHDDQNADYEWISEKVANLRIFEDENEKMNYSLKDVNGEILLISQFTLYGDARKGRRPSYTGAAAPDYAEKKYEECGKYLEKMGIKVAYGIFGADMKVDLVNDGPVTILLDSKKNF